MESNKHWVGLINGYNDLKNHKRFGEILPQLAGSWNAEHSSSKKPGYSLFKLGMIYRNQNEMNLKTNGNCICFPKHL